MSIGIDIVDPKRFEGEHDKKIFNAMELAYCSEWAIPSEHLAGKFAAKEAIRKALFKFGVQLPVYKITVLNKEDGSPYAKINDMRYDGEFSIEVSISHMKDAAVAVAVVDKCGNLE